MLPCDSCGQLAEDNARFCPMCGERITTVPAPPPPMPLPVPRRRRAAPLLIIAAILVGSLVLGIVLAAILTSRHAPASDNSDGRGGAAPIPRSSSGAASTTRLTVAVFNCAGCDITARPANGQPAKTAPVIDGQAQFTFPQRSTVGMSFQISHPAGFGSADGANLAVLAVDGVPPGARVGASAVIKSRSASVCWAGTLASASRIELVVEPFSDGTRAGDLRAWADPAVATLAQSAIQKANGTVEDSEVDACAGAFHTANLQGP